MVRSSFFLKSFRVLFFVLLVVFFGVVYDDVMYRLQELSFFVFDKIAMYNTISKPYGYCLVAARFLMQFFYYPLLGALLLSLFLSGSEWLLSKALRLPSRFGLLTYVLPMAVVFLICAPGMSINFQYEPSTPFLWACGAFLAALIIFLVSCAIRHGKKGGEEESNTLSVKNIVIQSATAIIIMSAVSIFAFRDKNFMILTKMQRQLDEGKWQEMVNTADRSEEPPTRSITAYRLIALVGLNKVGDQLFRFDYVDQRIAITGKDPDYTDESYSYMPEIHFYAGMINTSYRLALARIVFEGPSYYAIKRLAKCAILNRDWELADKYISILDHSLFQQKFAKKYRPLLYTKENSFKDKELDTAFELMPIKDKFDQEIQMPFYLQYYRTLGTGKTYKSLELAMAACLYTKRADEFLEFVEFMPSKQNIPVHIQEALAMLRIIKNKNYYPEVPISKDIAANVVQFLKAASTLQPEEGKLKLKQQYGKSYPYYYFYGNERGKATDDKKALKQADHDGIN